MAPRKFIKISCVSKEPKRDTTSSISTIVETLRMDNTIVLSDRALSMTNNATTKGINKIKLKNKSPIR